MDGRKLLIAGGREYAFSPIDYELLDGIEKVRLVISRGAKGADHCGEVWAQWRSIDLKIIPVQWDTRGRAVSPLRDDEIAKLANCVALFPGGKGTKRMAKVALRNSLEIFDFR